MKKRKNLLQCALALLLALSLAPTCLAADKASHAESTVTSEEVIDIIINSLCEEGSYDLSNEDYDTLRLYIKENDPKEILNDGSAIWILSETYTLVLTPERRLELNSGETVIKDRYAEYQTIDFGGLAEPAFTFVGLLGSTWMFDDIEGVIRRWTLGEQQIVAYEEGITVFTSNLARIISFFPLIRLML